MARPIRIEFENAAYHITARGNEGKAIYRDDHDRQRFLETLQESVERFGLVKKQNPNVDPARVRAICLELVEQS